MKKIFFILILYLLSNSIVNAQNDECFNCHQFLEDKPAQLFQNDIHHYRGLTCAVCHGGDSKSDDMENAMDPNKGFIGVPSGDNITEICITCHSDSSRMKNYGSDLPTDQYDQLKASVHGRLSISGKEKILQCTTCHNAHGIRQTDNRYSPVYSLNVPETCSSCHSNAVYMRRYNPSLPVDQYQKYKTSQHGILNSKGDPKPADCADCHGGHNIKSGEDVNSLVYETNIPSTCSQCHSNEEYMSEYNIPTNQYKEYTTSVHGIALLEKNMEGAPACNDCHGNHGAVPPGVETISNVCGNCHPLNAELFSESPHKKAFDEYDFPECETCHGNHGIITATNKLLGVDEEAVCSECHSKEENVEGYKTAKNMRRLIDSLDSAREYALELIKEAEQKGMEVSDAEFKLRDARQAKLKAKTVVHSFNMEKFNEVVKDKGLKTTTEVINVAQAAIDDYYFRRIGLGVSVGLISILCIALFLYIKDLDKKKRQQNE